MREGRCAGVSLATINGISVGNSVSPFDGCTEEYRVGELVGDIVG